jgi:outer membrane protein assembly factor BamB
VALHRPTICCSAIALTIGCVAAFANADPEPPPSVLPAQLAWTLPLNNTLTAPPAYGGARAFFPIDGDRLVAYDLVSGRQLWLISAAVRSKPAIGEDLLFTIETSQPDARADDQPAIIARRQADGSISWRLPLPEAFSAALVCEGGWIIVGTISGTVRALRASDGGVIWSANLPAPLNAPAAIGRDRVYLPLADGHVYALRLQNGEELWSQRLGDVPNEILGLDDRVYVGSNDKYFYALIAGTGVTAWRWPTGADVIGKPVVVGDFVYFVSLDNNLRALHRHSGGQKWMRPLPIRPTSGPVLAGDVLFVSGISRTIHGFRIQDGQTAADLTLSGLSAWPPAFVPGLGSSRPMLVAAVDDIEKGTTIAAYTRSVEPPVIPMAAAFAQIAKSASQNQK